MYEDVFAVRAYLLLVIQGKTGIYSIDWCNLDTVTLIKLAIYLGMK